MLKSRSSLLPYCRSSLAQPRECWDSMTNAKVYIRVWPLFLPADNPMAADHCSSAGLSANKFCRTCEVGGTKIHKTSEEGYESLFHVSFSPSYPSQSPDFPTISAALLEMSPTLKRRFDSSWYMLLRRLLRSTSPPPFVGQASRTPLRKLSSIKSFGLVSTHERPSPKASRNVTCGLSCRL